jgi:hypothetical protein
VDGAVLKNPTLTDAYIVNSNLASPAVTGGIAADAATLAKLGSDVQPYLEPYPTAGGILAELANCAGVPLKPGDQVPTCGELTEAIANASIPENVLQALRSCEDLPLVPGTKLVTCEEFQAALACKFDPAKILAGLSNCDGVPLAPGVSVPTCGEMTEAINVATDPAKVAGVFTNDDGNPLSPGTQLLSKSQIIALILAEALKIINEYVGPMIDGKLADLDFIKPGVSGAAPAKAAGVTLPADVFGARTALMGAPTGFLPVAVNGANYLVPMYGV